MTSTQLKTIFTGLTCFAVTAIFAQDTTMKPKTDTSKWPKHDSTKVNTVLNQRSINQIDLFANISQNDKIVVAKNEMEEETLSGKYFIKIES